MTDDEHVDFLLRCDQCGAPPGRLVAKYLWMNSQGHWVPVAVRGKRNVTITSMRGDEADNYWFMHLDSTDIPDGLPLPEGGNARSELREHHEIRCGTTNCRNKAAADDKNLQFLFLLIERAQVDARKEGRRDWVYLLAELATVDEERKAMTLTLAGLRAALTLNNAKWARHTRA